MGENKPRKIENYVMCRDLGTFYSHSNLTEQNVNYLAARLISARGGMEMIRRMLKTYRLRYLGGNKV